MVLDFKCWHCRSKVILQSIGGLYNVECTGPDCVCGIEGCGPQRPTKEEALFAYHEKVAEYKRNIADSKQLL
jgi:hypothetical protein